MKTRHGHSPTQQIQFLKKAPKVFNPCAGAWANAEPPACILPPQGRNDRAALDARAATSRASNDFLHAAKLESGASALYAYIKPFFGVGLRVTANGALASFSPT